MKKIITNFILCLILTAGFVLFISSNVSAASSNSCKITQMHCTKGSYIQFDANISSSSYIEKVEIYRAASNPKTGGKFELIDTILESGPWYTSSGKFYVTGQKRKVTLYLDSSISVITGNVTFSDSTPLRLFKTYYYYIRCISTDGLTSITSPVKSIKIILDKPSIRRAYSTGNTSAKISWHKVNKATGYVVYKYSNKKWVAARVVKGGNNCSATIHNLKSKATNYLKVKAYYTSGGKYVYGPISSHIKVKLRTPTVTGKYYIGSVYGPSLNKTQLLEIRRVVQSFKDSYIKSSMNDYQKLLTAFNYLRANCGYAQKGWQYNNANTAWGALVYGEAQCSGFARAMIALCDGIGIDCRHVHANAQAINPSHQWNQIKIDGKWYILDAQSGFFLVGSDLWKNFMAMRWDTAGLPPCSKTNHLKWGITSSIV